MEGKVIHSFGDSRNTDLLYVAPSPQYYCGVFNILLALAQALSTLLWLGVQHFLNIVSSPLNIVVGEGGGGGGWES